MHPLTLIRVKSGSEIVNWRRRSRKESGFDNRQKTKAAVHVTKKEGAEMIVNTNILQPLRDN